MKYELKLTDFKGESTRDAGRYNIKLSFKDAEDLAKKSFDEDDTLKLLHYTIFDCKNKVLNELKLTRA